MYHTWVKVTQNKKILFFLSLTYNKKEYFFALNIKLITVIELNQVILLCLDGYEFLLDIISIAYLLR